MPRALVFGCLILSLVLLGTVPSHATTIEKEFPFEVDEWIDIDVTDGPITVHRIRVKSIKGNWKSRVTRPTNAEFTKTVQIQIDCTNESSRDVEADLDIVWVDSKGREIDGYRGEEDIDEEELGKYKM